jgi:Putative prokaryotic signal transducing protein
MAASSVHPLLSPEVARLVPRWHQVRMIEILRTSDPVLLSRIEALLDVAGIGCFVADQHISMLEGGIGAFPRRLLVLEEDADQARRLIRDDGLGHELNPRPGARR